MGFGMKAIQTLLERCNRHLCGTQERGAFGRQVHAGATAHQKLPVEDLLEFLQRLGDGGLGQMELLRRALQAAFARDLDEALNMTEFDAPVDHFMSIPITKRHDISF